MSVSSSTAPNGQSSQGIWSIVAPYVTPPLAAGTAIVPVFYGFMAKTEQQLGNPIPRMSVKEALTEGCKAAPTISLIVGTQMIAQNVVEKALKAIVKKTNDKKDFAIMLASSMFVGAVSAPALAVFNAQSRAKANGWTMKQAVVHSLKSLSAKQTCAIVVRETSFLFALRVAKPVSEFMKRTCGENKAVEYGSTFATGAIGSLIGHPADTALTLWQEGMKVKSFSQSMRGAPIKAVTVGGFSVGYKIVKEFMERNSS